METLLDDKEKKIYMSLVGMIGYISTTIRHDSRFAYFVLSRKLANPRKWDLYLATWVMEYLGRTKDLPLILGGEKIQIQALSDASFGVLDERRSIKACMLRTSEESGAIYSNATSIKNAVTSVWEAEVNAVSDGIDAIKYIRAVCDELKYEAEGSTVFCDSESSINWLQGENITTASKHVEVRIYRMRHLVRAGEVNIDYIETKNNIADILTKSLSRKQFEFLRSKLMGHQLVKGKEVKGVINIEEESED